jgi:uncharacterized protein (TIGR03084 family)
MPTVDDPVVTALAQQQAELAALVDPLDAAGLDTPSRCPGWSVADVLLHLSQTNELAVVSVEGRWEEIRAQPGEPLWAGEADDMDALAGVMVEAERVDALTSRARWRASAAALEGALADVDAGARVRWVAGELAARTLATTRLTEGWIHTVDVAVGLGVDLPPTDRLWHVARLAWRTVPYALAQEGHDPAGPVRFTLTAPDGSSWTFGDEDAPTVITGPAVDLCAVAGQRAAAADTGLWGEGPDAEIVLRLVRTFA